MLITLVTTVQSEERRLDINSESFDFGYIPQKSKLHRIFWLRNFSEDTVRIHDVIPGCGCTQMPMDKEIISPGDSARLEIIFDSKLFVGPISKRPQFQVEEEFLPYVLPISCYVVYEDSLYKGAVQPSPRRASFGSESGSSLSIQLQNQSDVDLTVRLIERGSSDFSVDFPKTLAKGQLDSAQVKLKSGAKPFESSFTLEFVGPDQLVVSRWSAPVVLSKSTDMGVSTKSGSQ